jgi:hypothetical protein
MKPMTISQKALSALIIASGMVLGPLKGQASGGRDGGGGNAVLCYVNTQTKQQVLSEIQKNQSPYTYTDLKLDKLASGFKPELLDLWEARKPVGFPGQQVKPNVLNMSPEKIYERLDSIAKKIVMDATSYRSDDKVFYASDYLNYAKTTLTQWKAEPAAVLAINDMTLQAQLPKNCLIAQVAFYDDVNNLVHFDSRIVSLMSAVDQSALRVHEDIYKARRVRGDEFDRLLVSGRAVVLYKGGGLQGTDVTSEVRSRLAASRNSDAVRILVGHLFVNAEYNESTKELLEKVIFPKF